MGGAQDGCALRDAPLAVMREPGGLARVALRLEARLAR